MTRQSSPVITDMKVIPVAGHDSMLLNIGGAHNAYFTRNIVVLTNNAGHTGVARRRAGSYLSNAGRRHSYDAWAGSGPSE
ncbi:glucarate dehydratase 2 [Salmonella enterica subsp. arizonae]|uniref:Glucarate dehydratase 2 n=1 Tax=Salmonella enterica subsp. arizonae TaxID=59203 RepID=A0A379SQ50_SALER|nr:glucarate dehydratase 2 [Salmonella enterica subsp. arizonae]